MSLTRASLIDLMAAAGLDGQRRCPVASWQMWRRWGSPPDVTKVRDISIPGCGGTSPPAERWTPQWTPNR